MRGKVLSVATGQVVGEPQVIGKATLEAVDKFVGDAKSRLK